jgi:amino acid adenylation domain-containing protein
MGSVGTWFPLSHGQEALWFLWKLAPESWAYNVALPVGIRGALDVAAFRRALQKLSDRHPCLRMEITEEGGVLRQRALEQHRVALGEIDASDWSEARLHDALRDEARRPFNLEESAAMRVRLFSRGSDRHSLIIVVHHIACDLWSFIVMMEELRDFYQAEKAGARADIPPLPVGYEDYVHWQRASLESEAGERLWRYWQEQLAGDLPALDLPTDRSRPPMQSFRGGTIIRRLDAELTRQLKSMAGKEGCTPYMALLAAYQVLLHRYTGQEDILVGGPISGRHRAEFNGVVGDFVNMVPLRADLTGKPSFRQMLGQVRAKVVGALKHQDYPFSLLVDRLQPTRDLSRSPIFQTSFVLQQFHRFKELSKMLLPGEDEATIPFGDLALEPVPLAQQDGQFDLNLEVKENDRGELVGAWKYAADLFEEGTVAQMAASFETLLRAIVAHPERPVAELPLLTPEESQAAIARGQGGAVELPSVASVCELFEAQIERSGDEIAVSCGDDSVTYAELGRRVERLACSLVELGVAADVLVAVLLPRGLDFVALLLAISKAGGAFLPLDPRHPQARILQILESSGTPLVLTSAALESELRDAIAQRAAGSPDARLPRVVRVEDLESVRATVALPVVRGGDLAYVMFTSGSTGAPKGVMVEHRGMINHVLGKLSDLGMGANDRLAQNGPQSFDIVVWQCLAPLIQGGRVVVFPDEVAEDPAALLAEVEKRRVTVLQVVPSMLNALLEEATARAAAGVPPLTTLRWMVPTGEALPAALCRRWLEVYPTIPVLNTYGSTECSDDQCHYVIRSLKPVDEVSAVVSIGSPVPNMAAYVLDGNLAPVPVGVVGELYIGGLGVGRGYLHDPARTQAAFIPDPFSQQPGARLYRTRDLARRRADGNLDFLGRVDHMIKIRGFRIEPGEIETALALHPAIREAAVLARVHPAGERRLVGYVVPSKQGAEDVPGGEELRKFLAARLPQYMVPATYCVLEALPLTANGKLDLSRLPAPDWQTASAEEFVAPRTPTEEQLAGIWAEVLRLQRVGVTDDFFAIGGDSIASIQVVARCKRAGLDIHPSDVFLHKSVAALAALADSHARTSSSAGSAGSVGAAGDPALIAPLPLLQIAQEHLEIALGQVDFNDD